MSPSPQPSSAGDARGLPGVQAEHLFPRVHSFYKDPPVWTLAVFYHDSDHAGFTRHHADDPIVWIK